MTEKGKVIQLHKEKPQFESPLGEDYDPHVRGDFKCLVCHAEFEGVHRAGRDSLCVKCPDCGCEAGFLRVPIGSMGDHDMICCAECESIHVIIVADGRVICSLCGNEVMFIPNVTEIP